MCLDCLLRGVWPRMHAVLGGAKRLCLGMFQHIDFGMFLQMSFDQEHTCSWWCYCCSLRPRPGRRLQANLVPLFLDNYCFCCPSVPTAESALWVAVDLLFAVLSCVVGVQGFLAVACDSQWCGSRAVRPLVHVYRCFSTTSTLKWGVSAVSRLHLPHLLHLQHCALAYRFRSAASAAAAAGLVL
jgi:hypothetical protein